MPGIMNLGDKKGGQGKGGGDRGEEDWEDVEEWRWAGGWKGQGRGRRTKSTEEHSPGCEAQSVPAGRLQVP